MPYNSLSSLWQWHADFSEPFIIQPRRSGRPRWTSGSSWCPHTALWVPYSISHILAQAYFSIMIFHRCQIELNFVQECLFCFFLFVLFLVLLKLSFQSGFPPILLSLTLTQACLCPLHTLRPLLPSPSEVLSICPFVDLSLYRIPVCICLLCIKWVFYGPPITGSNHPSSVFSMIRQNVLPEVYL